MQVGQVDSIQSLDILISGLLNGAAGRSHIFTKPQTNIAVQFTDPQLNFGSDTVNP